VIESQHAGCRGCSSGAGGYHNIFGNKYGQYLAAIQIAREKKREAAQGEGGSGGDSFADSMAVFASEQEQKEIDEGGGGGGGEEGEEGEETAKRGAGDEKGDGSSKRRRIAD
jgi:bud site selection protein 31